VVGPCVGLGWMQVRMRLVESVKGRACLAALQRAQLQPFAAPCNCRAAKADPRCCCCCCCPSLSMQRRPPRLGPRPPPGSSGRAALHSALAASSCRYVQLGLRVTGHALHGTTECSLFGFGGKLVQVSLRVNGWLCCAKTSVFTGVLALAPGPGMKFSPFNPPCNCSLPTLSGSCPRAKQRRPAA